VDCDLDKGDAEYGDTGKITGFCGDGDLNLPFGGEEVSLPPY